MLQQRSVLDNLSFFARFGASGAEDIRSCVREALDHVGASDLASRLPPQLSAIERGRVAIARALLRNPPVLLLDDPLSLLEGTARAEARAWLRQLIASLECCTLIATRDPIEAMAIADQIVVMNDGAIEQEGPPEEVYNEPATVFAAGYMARSNRLPGTLIENAGTRACLEVMGCQISGITQTRAPVGSQAIGLIRVERTRIGGGPGPNRVPMTVATQMYVGERWEVVFTREGLNVLAYTSAPLATNPITWSFRPTHSGCFEAVSACQASRVRRGRHSCPGRAQREPGSRAIDREIQELALVPGFRHSASKTRVNALMAPGAP
jgi:iron(III) transport system ATP-binding protein